jgi:predicted phosphodiesterase
MRKETSTPDPAEEVAGEAPEQQCPPLDNQPAEASAPYRILHISDVHFGAHFDDAAWEYVRALAQREKPNLIACTGDLVDHGGLFMLAAAKLELDRLRVAVSADAKLRCVPGNHDCGPFGNLNIWPFSSNFAAIFGPQAMNVPSLMSPYLVYRKRSWCLRWIQRAVLTPYLYVKRFLVALARWLKAKSLYELPILREEEDPEALVLIYLDSNYTQRLASGSVDPKEVTLLKSRILNLRDAKKGRSFVPRIALVHHHPLPIPEASITEGLTSFEPFLVLRNAGFVLRELSRSDVDLVLHGHKHYSAFGRLGYSVDHRTEGEIAVLAAGSCGVTLAETGRNSINIIDVFETGRMSYTAVYFGGGGGVSVNELFRNKAEVHGMAMHKARVHRRAAERQGQWVDIVTHAVAVDPGGVAVVQHGVVGHVFDRSLATDVIPVVIEVTMGRVADTTLDLTETSKRAGHTWVDHPSEPMRKIRCGIDLGQRLSTSPPVDYGYRYVCFNTYAITEWETIAVNQRDKIAGQSRGRSAGMESTAFVVRVPMRTLILRLQLPPNASTSEPFVHVSRWSHYPDIPLDGSRQFFDDRPGRWVYDSDLSLHEAGNLVHIGSDAWELRVAFPLVGHSYEVKWRLPSPTLNSDERREETARRGRAESYRKALLTDTGLQSRLSGFARELRDWLSPYFRAHLLNDFDLDLAVFAYDRTTQSLRQVLAFPTVTGADGAPLDVPLGEGIVGAAFKRSEVVIYIDPSLTGSTDDAAYLYNQADEAGRAKPKWRFVVAFPVFALEDGIQSLAGASFDDWDPQSTVGVLTIASTASDSGLLSLTEGEDKRDTAVGAPATERQGNGSTSGSHLRYPSADDTIARAVQGPASEGQPTPPPDASEVAPTAVQVWGFAHVVLEYFSKHGVNPDLDAER